MEEILASIKRVIADDGRPVAGPRGRKAPAGDSEPAEPGAMQPPPGADEEDVLELSNPLPAEDDGLISENVTAATRSSLATLAAMRQQNARPFDPQPGEGPLEAVVREMLRPMLKEWLDTRLPEMVEDMVAREIARITGKNL